jgi:uncharacterized protein YunC (DUF1805 family)
MPLKENKLEKYQIELARPLLLIKANKGVLGCGYLSVETFNKTGEVFALVTGVSNFDEMMESSVVSVSNAALQLGIAVGDTGAEAISKMLKNN